MASPVVSALKIHRRRLGLVGVLAASGLLTLGSGMSSLALFTNSKDATSAFSTGTINLTLSPTTVFTASAIMPGNSGSQTLTVTNGGTGAARYAMATSATNTDGLGLATQLQLTIKAGTCPGGGAALYGPAAVGAAALGSPAAGAQAGDRALAAGASETLCFSWSLASATGNAYQGATTAATFTFSSEQTSNNP